MHYPIILVYPIKCIESILRIVRGLTLRIGDTIFSTTQHRDVFQKVVEATKKIELIHPKKYGYLRDKRSHTFDQFNVTLFEDKGISGETFTPSIIGQFIQLSRHLKVRVDILEGFLWFWIIALEFASDVFWQWRLFKLFYVFQSLGFISAGPSTLQLSYMW